MAAEEVIEIEPETQILQPAAPGAPLLLDDIFPALDIAGREEEINAWFENDIKRCAAFVQRHQGTWDLWREIYDLENRPDIYADIGGRADYPSGLLCEKTIEATDRLMRAIYTPDPLFAVDQAMFADADIEQVLRYEHWMDSHCRNILKLESVFGKRALLDFLLFGSLIAEPDTLFKVVPQRTVKVYRTPEELEADQAVVTDISALDEKFILLDQGVPVRLVVERDNVEEMGLNVFIVDLTDHLIPPNVYRDEEIRFRARRLYYTESDLRVLASDAVGWYSEADVEKVIGQRSVDVTLARDGREIPRYIRMKTDAGTAPGFEWFDMGGEYGNKRTLPYEDVYIVFRIFARYAYPTRKDPRGVIPKWTVWEWEPSSQTILRASTYPHFDERLPWIHFRLGVSKKSYYGFGFGALLEKEDSRQTSILNLFLDSEANAAYPPYLIRAPEAGGTTPFRFGMGPGQAGYVQNPAMDFKQVDLRGPSQNLLGLMYPISSKLAENRTGVTSYTMGQTESTDPRSPARKTELLLGQAQLSLESIIRDWNIGWEQLARHIWQSVYETTIIRGPDEKLNIVESSELESVERYAVSLDDLEKPIRWISQASAGVVNPQARKTDFINKFSFFIPLIQRLWQVNQEVGMKYFLRWMIRAASELELRGKRYLIPSEAELKGMPAESIQELMTEMQQWTKAGGREGITPQPATPQIPAPGEAIGAGP